MLKYHSYSYILLLLIKIANSYIMPQTLRYFYPIGIYNNINKNIPYSHNIGTLPFITWFPNNSHSPITIINSCKHIGNNLKNSKLTDNNNCLICPFHNTIYNNTDNFGTTIIKNNIIWWSYKSFYNNPPYLKYNDDVDVKPKEIIINVNYLHFILNIITPLNLSFHNKDKLFFKNKLIKLLYIFPFTIFIKNKEDNITSFFTISPIDYHNIKLYYINYSKIKKIKKEMEDSYNPFLFKYMTTSIKNNPIMKLFDKYEELNDNTIYQFLKNYKYL